MRAGPVLGAPVARAEASPGLTARPFGRCLGAAPRGRFRLDETAGTTVHICSLFARKGVTFDRRNFRVLLADRADAGQAGA
jgi:hypothetical protein